MNVLIIAGGSRLGLRLTREFLSKGHYVDVITSSDLSSEKSDRLKYSVLNWRVCDQYLIYGLIDQFQTERYDVIIFNQALYNNHYFDLEKESTYSEMMEDYQINNLYPDVILRKNYHKIHENTKVVWLLSGSIQGWDDPAFLERHGDKTYYATSKVVNYYYMTGYAQFNRGIYVCINPGHFGSEDGETYEVVSDKIYRGLEILDSSHSGGYYDLFDIDGIHLNKNNFIIRNYKS